MNLKRCSQTYIDELEELILEYLREKRIEGPSIRIYTTLILLYANDVILLAHKHTRSSYKRRKSGD